MYQRQLLSFAFISLSVFSCHSAPTPVRQFLFRSQNLLEDETGNSDLTISGLSDENKSPDCPSTLPGCLAIAERSNQVARTIVDLTDADGLSVCTWMKFTSIDDYMGSHMALSLRRPGCRSWTCTYQSFTIRLDSYYSAPWPNQLYSYRFPNDHSWELPHPADQLWRTFEYNFTDKYFVYPLKRQSTGNPPEWHHVCWVTDKSDIRVYVDGAQSMYGSGVLGSVENTLDGMFSEQLLEIALSPSAQDYWGGRQGLAFGDVQVFNTSINPGHVQDIFETDYMWPANVCRPEEQSVCSPWAGCRKANGTAECVCVLGYEGDGIECTNINECALEDKASVCHHLAYCDDNDGSYECTCPEGFLGDGFNCQSDSWSLRAVFTFDNASAIDVHKLRVDYARVVTGDAKDGADSLSLITAQSPIVETASVRLNYVGNQITISALFAEKPLAEAARAIVDTDTNWTVAVGALGIVDGPDVYRWSGRSTSNPYQVQASGFSTESVHFEPSCLDTGCWVLEVTYSIGTEDFNVFYLPKAEASDQLSYDPDYSKENPLWSQSPADTFSPNTHPCTSANYVPSRPLTALVSACCLASFNDMYRPMASFPTKLPDLAVCTPGLPPWTRDRSVARETVPVFAPGQLTAPGAMGAKGVFVEGAFSGMDLSYGEAAGVVDPFVGIYKAKFYLDEKELRTRAGQLKGTVGVEHSVDTFLGLLNLSPTGTAVLDTFATQVAIHLEKTSFFSVSTHGSNAYTFLEYVNLRLIVIYHEDADFSGADESTDRTVRTDPSGAAHYVQLTFTLGSQYEVNANSGLVPLDSVRAGRGVFVDGATLTQKCSAWEAGSFEAQAAFNASLSQACAPAAAMCVSPSVIPDSFVSFNIPLGVDFVGSPSSTLGNNVFVDLVVSAEDAVARGDKTAPNSGEAPWQVKTTLSASIPVVEGGVNIFCDGFTAKTDLKDVATVDIIIGSAASAAELANLRILEDIASTQLDPQAPSEIKSDSIESGLMTVVLKGDEGFFGLTGNAATSIELEDLITIHIMDAAGSSGSSSKVSAVAGLLSASPADNSDANGLDTDGYTLNDAFSFSIDRSSQRAHLDPSPALLAVCPFSPPRPRPGNTPLATCVTRRDVQFRGFPWRSGARSTAMEVCAAPTPGSECEDCCGSLSYSAPEPDADESRFLGTILGSSDYTHQLAIDFARAIDERYALNGRYRRAFWVNPGYEWTPTQTGAASLFALSQKVFLFALVTLDERITAAAGKSITDIGFASTGPNLLERRRMLLVSGADRLAKEDGGAVGSVGLSYAVTQQSMMAATFNLPVDHIASFDVSLQLTASQACLPTPQLQEQVRIVLDEYLAFSASAYSSVQITSMTLDLGDEVCSRRRLPLRKLLDAFSTASVEVRMLVAFAAGKDPRFDQAAFAGMQGVNAIEPAGDISGIAIGALNPDVTQAAETSDDDIQIVLLVGIAAVIAAAILLFSVAFFLIRRHLKARSSPFESAGRGFVQQSSGRSLNKAELLTQCRGGVDWREYQTKPQIQMLCPIQEDANDTDAQKDAEENNKGGVKGAAPPRLKTPKAVDARALKAELARDDADTRPPQDHVFNAEALKAELAFEKL